jgi:hypothetical protein
MILNCKKYAGKRHIQRSTWLPNIRIRWFHVIGDPTISSEYEYNESENIMYVQCNDTYEALPKKTYLAILAVKNLFPDVEYILKTDDDMKCEIRAFEAMLEAVVGYDYGGEIVNVDNDHESKYHYPNVSPEYQKPSMMFKTQYCPGRFYFLSRNTTRSLIAQKEFFAEQMYEDYAVGYLATRIPNLKILNLNAKAIFHDDEKTIELK